MTPIHAPADEIEDGFVLIDRMRVECATSPAARELIDRIDRWRMDCEQDGRDRNLVAYLRIQTTAARRRRGLRDTWLAKAAAHIAASGEWDGCVQLADEWDIFSTRGGWVAWRELKEPPPELKSELRRALFYASRFHNGRPALTATGLFAISLVRSAFRASN